MVQGSIPRDHTMISLQFLTMIGSKIYWVYCDYSLLEAPWSTLLAMLDLLIWIKVQFEVSEELNMMLCIIQVVT